MKWKIQCDDGTLRDVFRTPLGPEVADLMLDAIEGGIVFEVTEGGRKRRVCDRESALALLMETYEWNPDQNHQRIPSGRDPRETSDPPLENG